MKNESICVGLYSIIGCFNKVLAIGYEVGDSKKGMGDWRQDQRECISEFKDDCQVSLKMIYLWSIEINL